MGRSRRREPHDRGYESAAGYDGSPGSFRPAFRRGDHLDDDGEDALERLADDMELLELGGES